MFPSSDSEFDDLRALGDAACWRIMARQLLFALVPITLSLAAAVWLMVYAITAVEAAPTWLSVVALVALLSGGLGALVHMARTRPTAPPRVPSPPAVLERDGAVGWWLRISGLPLVALAAYHLILDGWPGLAATVVALLGWLGLDLAQIAIFPARQTLYRLQVLTESTTVPGT